MTNTSQHRTFLPTQLTVRTKHHIRLIYTVLYTSVIHQIIIIVVLVIRLMMDLVWK